MCTLHKLGQSFTSNVKRLSLTAPPWILAVCGSKIPENHIKPHQSTWAGVGLISFNSDTQTAANRAKLYTRSLVYMFNIRFVLELHRNQVYAFQSGLSLIFIHSVFEKFHLGKGLTVPFSVTKLVFLL